MIRKPGDLMATISVVVADDEVLIRGGITMLLSVATDIEVVAEVGDGRAAVEAVRNLQPNVAIIDVRMPVMDGSLQLD